MAFTDSVTTWHRGVKWTVYGVEGPVYVETLVDTGCDRCLMRYDIARLLGLDEYPIVTGGYNFDGFGGGFERVVRFAIVDIECPLIGLGRVSEPLLLAHDKRMPSLVIGSIFMSKHDIDAKLVGARMLYGAYIPINALSNTNIGAFIGPIHVAWSKEDQKQDQEDYQKDNDERTRMNSEVMRAKALATPPSGNIIVSRTPETDTSFSSRPRPTGISSPVFTFVSNMSMIKSVVPVNTCETSTSHNHNPKKRDSKHVDRPPA